MVDKQSPDENLFDDNFESEFDFGAEAASGSSVPKSSTSTEQTAKSKPKLKILLISAGLILLLTLYMGWLFLKKSTPTIPAMVAKTTEPAPKAEITPTEVPKEETTVLNTVPALTPQIKPTPDNFPKPENIAKPDNHLNDIAEAFSSADQTPQAHSKEGAATVKDLQKELFTPSQAVTSPPSEEQNTQMSDATNAMAKLSQQMDYTITQIKQLDAYTRDISATIAKLNSDISAMDNRILAVTNATSSLSKDLGSVKSEVSRYKPTGQTESFENANAEPILSRRRQAAPGCPMPDEPEYMVHAVIPGRAWLKTSKGQIITVTEGETLGNYGKVLVIDAANGVVLTNSGITFR